MKTCFFLFMMVVFAGCKGYSQSFQLINKSGASDYVIVLPGKPSEIERKAAAVFADFFNRSTGVKLNTVTEGSKMGKAGVYIGNTNAFRMLGVAKNIKHDGFLIYKKGADIFIGGTQKQGTLNGVYSFLERFLGVNCLAPDFYDVPKHKELSLPSNLVIIENPTFPIRDVFSDVAYDSAYASWQKNERLLLNKDKKMGTFAHTFLRMVPPDKYFKAHPEYYALNKGKRAPTQLCLSNKTVVKLFADTLSKMMKTYPSSTYWSVGQEDLGEFCHCDLCVKGYSRYGNKESGLLLEFVNEIARVFPDKYIMTFAYHETIAPPENIRPDKNVIIIYAPIDAVHNKSYTKEPANAKYVNYLNGWARLTDQLFIWDYVSNYSDVLAPYPNIHTYKDNIQLFRKARAKYVFEQGINQKGGELKELKTFLLCKLLWNPDYDQDSLINLFCDRYYGAAGEAVKQYIKVMENNLQKENTKLGCFGDATQYSNSYLKPQYLEQYDKILVSAAKAAGDQQPYARHVNALRISLDYYMLKAGSQQGGASFRSAVKAVDNERINRFKKNVATEKIQYLRDEKRDPVSNFIDKL